MFPVVSIIVPCFNQAQYLGEALESVMVQTYPNWECIIVNDGSPDDTDRVANEWCSRDKRFKYIIKANGGISSARNTGIEYSKGEFILPLDADDLIHPKYLEIAVRTFKNNIALSLVYCKAEKFGLENGEWELEKYNYQRLLLNNHIFCTAMYKKEYWANVTGYDEKFKTGYEDWDFWIKILNKDSQVIQIQENLFYYRIKESSRTKDMLPLDHEIEKWNIYTNNLKIYKDNFVSPISILNENTNLQNENKALNSSIKEILSSNSYTLGNTLLKPISWLKGALNIFKIKV